MIGEDLAKVQNIAETLVALRQEDGPPIPQTRAAESPQGVDVTRAVNVSLSA